MKNLYGSWNFVLIFLVFYIKKVYSGDNDYNILHNDGSFDFGGDSPDSYHYAQGNRNNVVRGEFGGRNPKTGNIDKTVYTAGPRGFRPKGKNIVRNYDLNQNGPRPIGSPDDPYYDPYEDKSYHFGFRTRTHAREENSNRKGDVTGKFSYTDDVGEQHNVEYIAGKRTGFHVKTPFPDSNPRAYGPLYFRGRGRPIPRGRTSIQRGLDGSYRFVSAGPDQRRTEVSDSTGHVRGSYTYLDEKGIQHSVHYIAGPETGYRVLKNVKGPHLPTVFPFGRPDIISPDFYYDYNKDLEDVGDVFGVGGTTDQSSRPQGSRPGGTIGGGIDIGKEDYDKLSGGSNKPLGSKPTSSGDDTFYDDYDLFGEGKNKLGSSTSTQRPGSGTGSYKPTTGRYPSSTAPESGGLITASTTPSYESGSTASTTNAYDGGAITSDNGVGGGYPDDGKPETPLSEYGPPGFGKPGGRPINEIDDDFGLFEPGTRPSRPPSKPNTVTTIHVGGTEGRPCDKCQGTIVTNVGDRIFTVPPGNSVRAYVQAIDLLPYESKVPSPSAQMRADQLASNLRTEELNAEEDSVVGDGKEDFQTEETSSLTPSIPEVTTANPNT
ncbi:hypothetical protein WA026_022342 [Henosepilachna vigintioctopunctata]|uniref:Uncharacterized protein n=1 Tax=Henosepilachna vigintioctopunctata TaxID=420089 RepID=A0AAW1V314_9CUCU